MKLYVGTSGYGYKEWKGKFYPEKMSPGKMPDFYAERFSTVEINNTARFRELAESKISKSKT